MVKPELYKNILKIINERNSVYSNGIKEMTKLFEKCKKELEEIHNKYKEEIKNG